MTLRNALLIFFISQIAFSRPKMVYLPTVKYYDAYFISVSTGNRGFVHRTRLIISPLRALVILKNHVRD